MLLPAGNHTGQKQRKPALPFITPTVQSIWSTITKLHNCRWIRAEHQNDFFHLNLADSQFDQLE